MHFFMQRRLFSVVFLLLLCLSASACGTSAPATPSTSSTGPSTSALMTLKACQLNTSINFFPVYVAQQKGYFTAQKLNVPKPELLQVGSKVVSAVESGTCDVGNGVITDAFNWAKVNSSARIIGSVMNGYIVDIAVSKKFEKDTGVSESSSLSDRIKALKGKTIGITGPGTGTQALLVYLFKQEGLDPTKDVTQVSLGSNNAAALAALKAGKVDALSFFSPIGQATQAQGIGDILISPVRGDIPGLRGDVHGVIYTKQSTIDTKSQEIAAYIRAINQAEVFIKQDPTEAQVLLNKYLNLGQSVTDAVYAATSSMIATTPMITEAEYEVAVQFHTKAGLITKVPPYNQLIAASTITHALS